MNYINIKLNTIILDQVRYEHPQIGPSLYLSILQLMVKSPDFKLNLNDTNIGLLSEMVKLDKEKMMEMIEFWVNELEIFDPYLFNHENVLYSTEVET